MKKVIVITLLSFAAFAAFVKAQSLTSEYEMVKAKAILAPATAGALMNQAFMRTGTITRTTVDGTNCVVISGKAFIVIPSEIADNMVAPPDGTSLSNLVSGTFKRTEAGFEVEVTLKK